jgi:hypothetical protein
MTIGDRAIGRSGDRPYILDTPLRVEAETEYFGGEDVSRPPPPSGRPDPCGGAASASAC